MASCKGRWVRCTYVFGYRRKRHLRVVPRPPLRFVYAATFALIASGQHKLRRQQSRLEDDLLHLRLKIQRCAGDQHQIARELGDAVHDLASNIKAFQDAVTRIIQAHPFDARNTLPRVQSTLLVRSQTCE